MGLPARGEARESARKTRVGCCGRVNEYRVKSRSPAPTEPPASTEIQKAGWFSTEKRYRQPSAVEGAGTPAGQRGSSLRAEPADERKDISRKSCT